MNHKIEDPTSHSAEILYFCFDPHPHRTRYTTIDPTLIASEAGHRAHDRAHHDPESRRVHGHR